MNVKKFFGFENSKGITEGEEIVSTTFPPMLIVPLVKAKVRVTYNGAFEHTTYSAAAAHDIAMDMVNTITAQNNEIRELKINLTRIKADSDAIITSLKAEIGGYLRKKEDSTDE